MEGHIRTAYLAIHRHRHEAIPRALVDPVDACHRNQQQTLIAHGMSIVSHTSHEAATTAVPVTAST